MFRTQTPKTQGQILAELIARIEMLERFPSGAAAGGGGGGGGLTLPLNLPNNSPILWYDSLGNIGKAGINFDSANKLTLAPYNNGGLLDILDSPGSTTFTAQFQHYESGSTPYPPLLSFPVGVTSNLPAIRIQGRSGAQQDNFGIRLDNGVGIFWDDYALNAKKFAIEAYNTFLYLQAVAGGTVSLGDQNNQNMFQVGAAGPGTGIYLNEIAYFTNQLVLQQITPPAVKSGLGQIFVESDGNLYYESPGGAIYKITPPATGQVSGSGTSPKYAKWIGISTLANSLMDDDGNTVTARPTTGNAFQVIDSGGTTLLKVDGANAPGRIKQGNVSVTIPATPTPVHVDVNTGLSTVGTPLVSLDAALAATVDPICSVQRNVPSAGYIRCWARQIAGASPLSASFWWMAFGT